MTSTFLSDVFYNVFEKGEDSVKFCQIWRLNE